MIFLAGALAVFLLLFFAETIKHGQELYVITTKNLILVRVGLFRLREIYELKGLSFSRGFMGLNIFNGSQKRTLSMDKTSLTAAEACLAVATRSTDQ